MNYIIENKYLKVQINKLGGSLSSIFDKENNKELLYQKEPNSWQGQDIAIFPFVARLKDKSYIYDNKEYSLRNHGLCRYYEFDEYLKTNDSITLLFKYNEDTLKEYPFKFEFYIEYKLINNTLYITYKVVNIDIKEMIFGIGAHPAFIINSKIVDGKLNTDDNYVQFDSKKDLTRIMFDEKGEFIIGEENFGSIDRIYTKKEYFVKYKTLCLKGNNINNITLVRANNTKLKFHYNNINYFVMWSFEETGSYVALEPWMSLPDYSDCSKDLKDKKTLIHLPSNNEYIFAYSITIDK